MRNEQPLAKGVLSAFILCVFILSMLMLPMQAFAATAGQTDSHGNIVPEGREEVDNSAPRPMGWGNAPQTTAEAMKQGW